MDVVSHLTFLYAIPDLDESFYAYRVLQVAGSNEKQEWIDLRNTPISGRKVKGA